MSTPKYIDQNKDINEGFHNSPVFTNGVGSYDEVDARAFRHESYAEAFKPPTKADKWSSTLCGKSTLEATLGSNEYKMNHSKRGKFLIFVHENFYYLDSLKGPFGDGENLQSAANSLDFETKIFYDLQLKEILHEVRAVAREDHSDADCLVVAIITRGQQGCLFSKNNLYDPKTIWSEFTAYKSPTLVGKPKLFFIQVSDEDYLARDNLSSEDIDSSPGSCTLPSASDFFFAYCNHIDYLMGNTKKTEKYYIQSLIHEFTRKATTRRDLISIILKVHNSLANSSNVNELPYFSSTLTKKLFFTPKTQKILLN